jgi:hypothetical protein
VPPLAPNPPFFTLQIRRCTPCNNRRLLRSGAFESGVGLLEFSDMFLQTHEADELSDAEALSILKQVRDACLADFVIVYDGAEDRCHCSRLWTEWGKREESVVAVE